MAHPEVTRFAFDRPDPLRGGGQAAGSAVRRRRRIASVRQLKSALADLQATVLQLRGTPGTLQAPSPPQAPLKGPELCQGSWARACCWTGPATLSSFAEPSYWSKPPRGP